MHRFNLFIIKDLLWWRRRLYCQKPLEFLQDANVGGIEHVGDLKVGCFFFDFIGQSGHDTVGSEQVNYVLVLLSVLKPLSVFLCLGAASILSMKNVPE